MIAEIDSDWSDMCEVDTTENLDREKSIGKIEMSFTFTYCAWCYLYIVIRLLIVYTVVLWTQYKKEILVGQDYFGNFKRLMFKMKCDT